MLLLKANGEVESLVDMEMELEQMQNLVGGDIEVAYLPGNRKHILIVNEEGLLKNLPYNQKASAIAGFTIVGDAIFMEERFLK